MGSWSFLSRSPESTGEAGAKLAVAFEGRGGVISLCGPLGAGKTAFVQGLAGGLGLDPRCVSSPTFVIASEYPLAGGRRLAHVDFYRIANEGELEAAGFLDLLDAHTILAVEWGDRMPGALPADRIELALERRPDGARVLRPAATGRVSAAVLARWKRALEA